MNIVVSLQIWLSTLLVIRALVVQFVPDREPDLTEPSLVSSQSNSIHHLNQTQLSPGISVNNPVVFCDGDQYGRDLIVADCKDAITGIKRSRQQVRFGERTPETRTWDISLPFRQIGSEDAAEEIPLVTLLCLLTWKQYRAFAQFNWS